jgi:hypothetical protein
MFILKERQCTCYLESQYNTRLFQAVGCSVNSLELKIMEDAIERYWINSFFWRKKIGCHLCVP